MKLDRAESQNRLAAEYVLGTMRGAHKRMEPLLVTLTERQEVFPLFQHQGTELIYMLQGAMEYGHGIARYMMRKGDALQFNGEVTHGPTHLITMPIKFLSVIAYGATTGSSPDTERRGGHFAE